MTLQGKRFLLAWEHGRNLGHMARLDEVARLLEQAGAQVVWAVPSTHREAVSRSHPGHRVFLSPTSAPRAAPPIPAPQSFADVLALLGFADPVALQPAVAAWLDLYAAERIDHVVLDYAPAAQLAALLAGLPANQITNGFDAPPPDCPLFGFSVRGPMLEQRNRKRIATIDATLRLVGAGLGLNRPLDVQQWLSYPTRWYDCIEPCDPYGPRSDGIHVGPIGKPASTIPVNWPEGDRQTQVFAYLRSASQARNLLVALADAHANVICALPGASQATLQALSSDHIVVVNRPVDLRQVLPECDVVVNYGSSTLVSQALLAGKPQLILATDLEKWLVARRIHVQGLGISLAPDAGAPEIGITFEHLRRGGLMRRRVERVAIEGRHVHGLLERAVHQLGIGERVDHNLCEERLGA